MTKPTTIVLTMLALLVCVQFAFADLPDPESTIKYVVSIRPKRDRTDMVVTVSFTGSASGRSQLELPNCRFGTPEIWNSISDITANGAVIKTFDSEKPWVRILRHEPNAKIELKYTLSRDPTVDKDLAYRPDISSSHFHFFGSQWRAKVVNRAGSHTFHFEFADVPSDWKVFSNMGDGSGPFVVEASDDELSGFIAGGKFKYSTFKVKDTPVSVYVLDSFADPERVVKATREIIQLQGEIFGGFGGEFYLVSVIPRTGIRAGTAIDNAFICLADAQTKSVEIDVLLAHEVFHNWLPHKGTIDCWRDGSDVDEFRLDWFVEGFTEYIARRVLLDSNRITVDQYVARFNQDLQEQATNPQFRASLEVVKEALDKRNFTNRHERTSYFRGPLIALQWEHRLAKIGKHTVIDLVKAFVSKAASNNGQVSEQEFFDLVEQFGIDGRADYQKHIVYGDPVQPPMGVFDKWSYNFTPKTLHQVDQGFSTHLSRKTGWLREVDVNGAAYKAGLRDGMKLIGERYARSPGKSTRLTIQDHIGGSASQREIEFEPRVIEIETGRFRFLEKE